MLSLPSTAMPLGPNNGLKWPKHRHPLGVPAAGHGVELPASMSLMPHLVPFTAATTRMRLLL